MWRPAQPLEFQRTKEIRIIMADTIKVYDRAQNNYALGVVDANAANILRLAIAAGATVQADVKIVPTDIWGRVLTAAKVTFNSGAAKSVEDGGNITTVALFTEVTYKVEAKGFTAQEGSISSIRGNQLIHLTMFPGTADEEGTTPENPGGSGEQGGEEPAKAAPR